MNISNNNIIKLCSFYVSDWHLVTMLLPYINKIIDNEEKVDTVLEKNIQKNIEILVNKLNIENNKKILSLDWKNKNAKKYTNISKIIDKNLGNKIVIIINGNKNYIEDANKNIEKYIKNNISKLEVTGTEIKIIDCYNIIEFDENIIEILDKHDKILNTSGEKEISEVFEDYEKKEKIV